MKKTIIEAMLTAGALGATALIWTAFVKLFCALALWGVA